MYIRRHALTRDLFFVLAFSLSLRLSFSLLSSLFPLSSLCNRTLIRVETHSTGDGPEERECARGAAATALRHAQANGTDSD